MKILNYLFVLLVLAFIPQQLFAVTKFSPEPIISNNISSTLANKSKPKKEFPFKQIVSFYPAKAIANYMMLGYERQVGPKHVLKIAVGYANFEEQNLFQGFNNEIKDFSGTRFDLMYKYFIGKEAIMFNGIYFAPIISFKSANFKYQDFTGFGSVWEDGSASALAGGFIFGAQFPLGDSFSVDLYIGDAMIKSHGNYREADRFMDSYRSSIGLISGFSFGFGF